MQKKSLSSARKKGNINNEFYTLYDDIQKEINHYEKHFENKTVFCNCDDPFESNFFRFFVKNFNYLKLKRLICTCYKGSPVAFSMFDYLMDDNNEKVTNLNGYVIDIDSVPMKNGRGVSDEDINALLNSKKKGVKKLKGDGDFRSDECIEYLQNSDMVVTNPPFSLSKELIPLLMKFNKKFLLLGDKNSIAYEEIFHYFKNNEIWLGYNKPNEFILPSGELTDIMQGRVRWFTNLDIEKRHEKLYLYAKFNKSDYPKLLNFDAVLVKELSKIPYDYDGVMAVPITYMDIHNPDEYEILGCSSTISNFGIEWKEPPEEFFRLLKEGKVRTKGNYQKSKCCWIDDEGYANVEYHKIFIRKVK